jgi:hypothetical protein
VGDGVGLGEVKFPAACWVLGEADAADAGDVADLDVADGVADENALAGGPEEEVEGTLDRGRVRLHQLGMAGDARYDDLDQVVEVEAFQERFDGLLARSR